jgi:hypothetical protein
MGGTGPMGSIEETMRAAVLHGRGDVRIDTMPVPRPAPGEVLLRTGTVGLCGTDASEFAHGPRTMPVVQRHPVTGHHGPMVIGHLTSPSRALRDRETVWTEEATGRITTENANLKQRVRQLSSDNRALQERLQAARSNLRFQERRLADLEAQLAHPPLDPHPQQPASPPEREA